MEKEYGKLTADQFREFIGRLPELRQQRDEFGVLIAKVPKKQFDQLMVSDFNWSHLYENTFAKHIAIALYAFNQLKWLNDVSLAPDPHQFALDTWPTEDSAFVEAHPDYKRQDLVGLAFSLQRTILSVMLFQRSMSGLIQEVRENDDMESLFNAIRVDRAAIACPSIADKIARAEIRGDKRFFLRLRNALKGPTQKHWASYCDLRYSLFTLRELGLGGLSDIQLENLLVHQLKVYPNTPSARKNLRAQYTQSKKIKTI